MELGASVRSPLLSDRLLVFSWGAPKVFMHIVVSVHLAAEEQSKEGLRANGMIA